MRAARLGEVTAIVSGATPRTGVGGYWDGDVAWATPADLSKLDGAYISTTARRLTQAGVRSCATSILPVGTVLLSSRAPIGHVAINSVPMATNQGFKSLIPGAEIDAKYLYHWLRMQTQHLQTLGNGATFKELSKKTVERVEVPLPALPEQRRIAAILDHSDILRANRRQVLAHLDNLTQSIFHDTFGGKDQTVQPLRSLVDADDRMNYGVVQPGPPVTLGVPLIRVSNLLGGGVDRGTLKQISASVDKAHARSRIRGNEVLVSSVGTVGAISLTGPEDIGSNIARAITRVPISDVILRRYVAAYLRTRAAQDFFISELRTVAQPTLNVGQLAQTPIPIPTQEEMRTFVDKLDLVQEVAKSSAQAQQSQHHLSVSLQSRAFRGVL